MDTFDEVRRMNITEVDSPPNSCNNATTNANNGYHTNSDIQNDYTSLNNTTNIDERNCKDREDASTAGEFQPNESITENQQNINATDLEHDKEIINSAEKPLNEPSDDEPSSIKNDVDNDADAEEMDNNEDDEINKNNSELVESEPVEDVVEKLSNGVDKICNDIVEPVEPMEVKEEVDGETLENETTKQIEKEDNEKPEPDVPVIPVEEIKIEAEPASRSSRSKTSRSVAPKTLKEEDDDDDVPLVKRSNKRSNSNKNASGQKRGPRGPYNRNRSKLEPATPKATQQKKEIEENQCRVCLVKDDLISIFKSDNKQTIADKLMTVCSGIHIQRKDFLPQFICNTCMQSVQVAYNLKVLCETTDKDLRSKLSKSKNNKLRRPATEYVLLDATKFPSDDSEIGEDNDDEFKLSNEETGKLSITSDATDSGTDYGNKRRSRRVRSKKTQQKRKRDTRSVAVPTPKTPAPPTSKTPAPVAKSTTNNSTSKPRPRKISSSPEKRISVDFSSGSEDDYTPPQRKPRTEGTPKIRSGPGPGAINAPKEAQCPYCNEMFPSQSALMKHKKIHSNQPLNCDMCGKSFKLLAAYQAHIDKHKTDGDSLKCDKCEKTFTKIVERKRHLIEIHNEKPETFPCEKCKRVFALKKTLERHVEENKCPGLRPAKPVVSPASSAPQKKIKPEMENLTLGRDLFKCVAPVTTTYWSDSFSD